MYKTLILDGLSFTQAIKRIDNIQANYGVLFKYTAATNKLEVTTLDNFRIVTTYLYPLTPLDANIEAILPSKIVSGVSNRLSKKKGKIELTFSECIVTFFTSTFSETINTLAIQIDPAKYKLAKDKILYQVTLSQNNKDLLLSNLMQTPKRQRRSKTAWLCCDGISLE